MEAKHHNDKRPSASQAKGTSPGKDAVGEEGAGNSPIPSVSLPKGGGAIQGIGEKFSVNAVTGTSSTNIPIGVSSARGLEPVLSLSYSSGSGNGPFGFGWALSLGSISRRTSKGIPSYDDVNESDTFVLSGVEDLVPVLDSTGNRWRDTASLPGYVVTRYRPRIDLAYSRIEKCTSTADPTDTFWRTLDAGNQLTIYGNTPQSRIFDPGAPERIFEWLMAEVRDQKGNVCWFRYKMDDATGVDLSAPHQESRGAANNPGRSTSRYLKSVVYGNKNPLLDSQGNRPHIVDQDGLRKTTWLFEVVFDYGEHDLTSPSPLDGGDWSYREDALSSYRSGFEVRTTRLCRRVLMFHHFRDEIDVGENYLVSSLDLTYSQPPDPQHSAVYNFLSSATHCGYRKRNGSVFRATTPPLEFEYSAAAMSAEATLETADPEVVEHLPGGIAGASTQWIDLFGEGIPGALTRNEGRAWFYKRNMTPLHETVSANGVKTPKFSLAPVELLRDVPSAAPTTPDLDLAGDGFRRLVTSDPASRATGYYSATAQDSFAPFTSFQQTLNQPFEDRNAKYLDVDGDGRAEVVLAGENVTWYGSFDRTGFKTIESFRHWAPKLLFCNDSESIHLSDFSGDGLTDVVRIRNGEVCYWPNLGNGLFGDKITMDNSPCFDRYDQFAPGRILLADVDGSGTTDIIYLHLDGPRVYFNQSGNGLSDATHVKGFPPTSSAASVTVLDLHGDGTPSLVLYSPLPSDARQPLKFLKLMPEKPHLLKKIYNNLGSTTTMTYVSSTKFYLQDKMNGTPWVTRLPFPVHVVETSTSTDEISKSRFTSRMAYHHGYFDGEDLEFRGFGMVERWDSESFTALTAAGPTDFVNEDIETKLPPTRTKVWYHLGEYVGVDSISKHYEHEYYQPASVAGGASASWLLPDTTLPQGIQNSDLHDACRALKGSMLRSEMYTDDADPDSPPEVVQRARIPHIVNETSYSVRQLQQRGPNNYPVFTTSQSESLTVNVDRQPTEQRISHTLVLERNEYDQILKQMTVSYGKATPNSALPTQWDRDQQALTRVVYLESISTNAIDDMAKYPFSYRLPVMCETNSYELTGFDIDLPPGAPYPLSYWISDNPSPIKDAELIAYEKTPTPGRKQKRLVSCQRTLFRRDDLAGLLPLGTLEEHGYGGERFKLCFTRAMLDAHLTKEGKPLLANPDAVLLGTDNHSQGGYLSGEIMRSIGLFPADTVAAQTYWGRSGQAYFSANAGKGGRAEELSFARQNFFLPTMFRDPFGVETSVVFDGYRLMVIDSIDGVGNRATVGDRDAAGNIGRNGIDYRVLKPKLVTDANRNRAAVKFDALGRVIATAAMGKTEENLGDSVDGIDETPDPDAVLAYLANPTVGSEQFLGNATSRVLFDEFAYMRTKHTASPQPARTYAMSRSEHASSGAPPNLTRAFAYSDGFGRTIQTKAQCKAGPVPRRDAARQVVLDPATGQPVMEPADGKVRWISEGWKIFNNKGKTVREYEPFFSDSFDFEFGVKIGVSPVVFYDAAERVCASLMPHGTYSKAVFGPWATSSWDTGDTVARDPRTDDNIREYVAPYFASRPEFQTWFAQRVGGVMGDDEAEAARKAAANYADTPSTSHFDSLGRPFLVAAHLKVASAGHDLDGTDRLLYTRVETDIEGNTLVVRDANNQGSDNMGRIVSKNVYDMQGSPMLTFSAEKGETWTLKNVLGSPIRVWDSRGQVTRSEYDAAGRPIRTFLERLGWDGSPAVAEKLVARLVYGESHPEAESRNLRNVVYLALDQSGAATINRHDFKGNAVENSTRLCKDYKNEADWTALDGFLPQSLTQTLDLAVLEAAFTGVLETETFSSSGTFDAANRPMTMVLPHSLDMPPNTLRLSYDVGSLARIECNLRGEAAADGSLVWTPFVRQLDYDAKSQRQKVVYGNGVSTEYTYNIAYQLVKAETRRNQGAPLTDLLQGFGYVYDPVSNISRITDRAQQTFFFRNQIATQGSRYTYDSLYRLSDATGREHLSQPGGAPTPYSDRDEPSRMDNLPGQEKAMANYRQQFVYDEVGNLRKMAHTSADNPSRGWTRAYTYAEPSLIEPQKTSDRVTSTAVGSGTENYAYDAHGNMTRMPHLGGGRGQQNMWWNYKDQLRQLDLGGGGTAYYTYNQTGQRVRKVVERSEQNLVEERIYLGDIELYRKRRLERSDGGGGNGDNGSGSGTGAGPGEILLERETLHVHDDHRRIAMVETRTGGTAAETDPAPRQLIRYQLTDHLSSATLEVDGDGRLLSYEEYSPYGSTTYQARVADLETPKRYRFTGKERDEESGFSYHSARYLATWLGRWLSADPAGFRDGGNMYAYVGGNPIAMVDPGGTNGKRVRVSIHESWPVGAENVPGGEDELYWRATAPENKQTLGGKVNSRISNSEPTLPPEPTPTPTSGLDNPRQLLEKGWGHTEEMVGVVKQAVGNIGPKPKNWTWPEYNEVIREEIKDLMKHAPDDAPGGRARAVHDAAGVKNEPGKGFIAGEEPPESPPPEKPNPMPARPPDAPERSLKSRYPDKATRRPGQVARRAKAAAEAASPAAPEPAPATAPAAPDPAPAPAETAPVEKAPTPVEGKAAPPTTETKGGGGGGGGKGSSLGSKLGSAVGVVQLAGAAGSVLRDLDQGNYGHAALTTTIVGGLGTAAKLASKFRVVGKALPLVGAGLMVYGTVQNLGSEEAHQMRDAAKGWVGQYTDNAVVGSVVGGAAQLGTAIVKTALIDPVRDIRDGIGVVGKRTGLW